jgi:hypothetical protein
MNKEDFLRYGNPEQLISIKRYECLDGVAKGNTVIDISNGKLHFTLNANRGLDIYDMSYKGVNVCFRSSAGDVSPKLAHGAAYTFTRYFAGGMLWTCGPDNIGDGDVFHGSFGLTPAENVNIDKHFNGGRYTVKVSGDIIFKQLFGNHIIINRTVTTEYNSPTVEVRDIITNMGYKPVEYYLLYHYNFGYPFISDETRILAPGPITPRTPQAAAGIKDADHLCAPEPGFFEHVFYRKLENGEAKITTPEGMSCTVKYDINKLPWLIQWKSMAAGDYALGLEPSTSRLDEFKTPSVLESGASEEYRTSLNFSD